MRRPLLVCFAVLASCGAASAQSAGGGTPVGSTSGGSGGTVAAGYAPCANQSFSNPALIDNSLNATLVVAGPATFCGVIGYARVQSPVWLKLYDEATVPNPQTDTPKLVVYVAPQEPLPAVAPMQFANGIGFAITWGEASANTTVTTGAPPIGGLNIGFRQ